MKNKGKKKSEYFYNTYEVSISSSSTPLKTRLINSAIVLFFEQNKIDKSTYSPEQLNAAVAAAATAYREEYMREYDVKDVQVILKVKNSYDLSYLFSINEE